MKTGKHPRRRGGKNILTTNAHMLLLPALVVLSLAVFHPIRAAEAPALEGIMPGFAVAQPRAAAAQMPFQDADGALTTFNDFRGETLLVNFWASWCAPCILEMPGLARLQQALADEKFRVLAISLDRNAETARRFMADKLQLSNLAVYHDPRMQLARALGVTGLPASLLLDGEGNIVGRYDGPAEWDSAAAKALIRAVLAAQTGRNSP